MNSLPFLALLALVCALSTVSAQTPTGFPTTLAPTAGQTVDKCDKLHGQAGIECKLGLSDLSAGGSGAETNALINLFIIFCCCSPLIGLGCFVLCAPGFGILLLVKGLAGTVHTSEVGERVTDISILGNGPFFFISALKLPMLYAPLSLRLASSRKRSLMTRRQTAKIGSRLASFSLSPRSGFSSSRGSRSSRSPR